MSRTPARGLITASGAVSVLATLCLMAVSAHSSSALEADAMPDSALIAPSMADGGNQGAVSGSVNGNWVSLLATPTASPSSASLPASTPTAPPSPIAVDGSDAQILLPARGPSHDPSAQAGTTSSASGATRAAGSEPSPSATPTPREQSRTSSLAAVSSDNPRDIAKALAATDGWTGAQWVCLDKLWRHESDYETTVRNPHSGAYGIPQALPASKMSSAGPDWRTNPVTQIMWGLGYIGDRYGTPCGAWSYWLRHNFY